MYGCIGIDILIHHIVVSSVRPSFLPSLFAFFSVRPFLFSHTVIVIHQPRVSVRREVVQGVQLQKR
jgi:hypothetical protein